MTTIDKLISEINISASDAYFGEVVYRLGGTCGPRLMPDLLFVAVYKGDAEVHVGGAKLMLPAQHIIVVPPGSVDSYQFSKRVRTHHSWCGVVIRPAVPELRPAVQQLPRCIPLTQQMSAILELGIRAQGLTGALATRYRARLGEALLYAYVMAAEGQLNTSLWPAAMENAVRFVRENFAKDCSLPQIAHAAHVTPTHLVRLFRKCMNNTPIRYLWSIRVEHGVELLRSTGLSVSEVAYQSGFQSPFHFARMVRGSFNATPTEIRKQLRRPLQFRTD